MDCIHKCRGMIMADKLCPNNWIKCFFLLVSLLHSFFSESHRCEIQDTQIHSPGHRSFSRHCWFWTSFTQEWLWFENRGDIVPQLDQIQIPLINWSLKSFSLQRHKVIEIYFIHSYGTLICVQHRLRFHASMVNNLDSKWRDSSVILLHSCLHEEWRSVMHKMVIKRA